MSAIIQASNEDWQRLARSSTCSGRLPVDGEVYGIYAMAYGVYGYGKPV